MWVWFLCEKILKTSKCRGATFKLLFKLKEFLINLFSRQSDNQSWLIFFLLYNLCDPEDYIVIFFNLQLEFVDGKSHLALAGQNI